MEDQAETRDETKHSRGFGRYVFWTGVVVLLYVSSSGPYLMIDQKGILKSEKARFLLEIIYFPVEWAYGHTPLQKPLGMYFHLWCPQVFDKKGGVNFNNRAG